MTERWLPVVGYEGVYSVSDQGRVMLVAAPSTRASPIRRLTRSKKGYFTVGLRNNLANPKTARVHRLVCAAFLGSCPNGYQVNHRNGVKTDNRLDNLEYVTAKENIRHRRDVLGIEPPATKLTEGIVKDLRERRRNGESLVSIALDLNVTPKTVSKAVHRRTWGHVD